jgi:tetratricopeptide (TPR) repeat protein
LKSKPKYQQALVLKGELLLKERRFDEALDAAKAAIGQAPPSAAAQSLAGRVFEASNRLDDAIAAYEEAIKIDPRAVQATFRLASIEYQRGQLDKAATHASEVLSKQRGNAEAFTLLARIDMQKGDLTSARGRVATLQKFGSESASTHVLQAELQVASKDLNGARASYERALQLDPNNYAAIVGANRIDMLAGRHQQAIARVEGALARTSRTPELLVQAALPYGGTGNSAKVEALLLEAIQKDPSGSVPYNLLGQWYATHQRLPEAIKQFETLSGHEPKSIGPITMIGLLLEAQGKTAEAEKYYEKALGLNSREAVVAANNLAWLYAESGRDLNRALELARSAYQQRPNDPSVADTLGWVYVKKNMGQTAIPYLLQADSAQAVVQFHRGMAYVQAGNVAEANRALKTALAGAGNAAWTEEARKALASLK